MALVGLASVSTVAGAQTPPAATAIDGFIVPPKLRPCCAFGHSLKTMAGDSSVAVLVDNIVSYDRLGSHAYAVGQNGDEALGLVYTCRGGTIDIAHVRDYADWTAYLYHRIEPLLGTAALIRLPAEGAERKVLIAAVPVSHLGAAERKELALLLSQRIAFDLSIWHEIATWYDHRSVPLISERLSAFSIEDMYSNLLGTYVGVDAVRQGGDYGAAVDAALDRRLRASTPLPPYHSKQTLNAVDGLWWDSSKAAPQFELVIRRNLDFQGEIRPWLVPAELSPYCRHREEPPLPLSVPERGPSGAALAELYELRFTVDLADMRSFDLPPSERTWVTQRDYPFIVSQIRRRVREQLGPFGDRQEIDADTLLAVKRRRDQDLAHECGSSDPQCGRAREDALHGIHVANIFAGVGHYAGLFAGFTLADISTRAGGINVLRYDSALGSDNYMLHALAIETPDALFLCSKRAEDGSGDVALAYPYVNPFEVKCEPGSAWGLKLDLFELLYDSKSRALGLRPFEIGVGYNALRNGHSRAFLQNRLVITLTVAPEFLIQPDLGTQSKLFGYFSVFSTHHFWENRVGVRVASQIGVGGSPIGVKTENSVRAFYNVLFTKRTGIIEHPAHTSLRVGLELGANHWPSQIGSLPSMTHKFYLLRDRDLLPDTLTGDYHAIVYVEASLPSLVVF